MRGRATVDPENQFMRLMSSLLPFVALLIAVGPFSGAAGATQDPESKPLLKPADRDSLANLFADYFKHRSENTDLKKLSAALVKLEDDLKKKAKSAKISTLLESPADLRSAMSVPFLENKNMKKGFFFEDKTTVEIPSGSFDVGFLYRLPKNYAPKTQYPVVVALAPKMDNVDGIKKWADAAFPDAVAELAILVVPLNLKGFDWLSLEGMMTALFPLRQVQNTYSVDRGRVILDGSADAGAVVVNYVAQYPSLFTAAVLRGASSAPAVDLLSNARYVPFFLVADAAGEAAKIHGQFAQDCTAAGVKAQICASPVDQSGKLGDPGSAEYAKFLTETRKTFVPRDIKFTTASPQNVNAYWLEISRLETGAGKAVSVEATIDRTTNEIRITAPPQVKELVIYLNQDVVDMGKEFKVIVTEKTADNPKTATGFQGKKENSLDHALALWFENRSANSGEVYTNYVKVTMP
jgi:hypothetical protein